MKVAQFDKAQEMFHIKLNQTTDKKQEGTISHSLACIKKDQGKNKEAFSYCEKAHEVSEKTLPANHSSLATSYNDIGLV